MTVREWYYSNGDQQIGPLATNTIIELIELGVVGRTTLVWHPSMTDWCGLDSIQELAAHLPQDPIREAAASIERQPKSEMRSSNYIVLHWRGELTLAVSWWVNGFLLNIFLTIIDFALFGDSGDWSPDILILYLVGIITVYVWQVVGIWRASTNYIYLENQSIPRRSGLFGRLAQFFTIIGAISNITTFTPIFYDALTLNNLSQSEDNEMYYIQRKGNTDVLFNGYISESSVSELISTFEADSELSGLLVNSPGGLLVSAFRLADYIEQNNLTVAATSECISACMLLLASADTAAASTNSSLIFHHPESRAVFLSSVMTEVVIAEIEEFYSRLERYGVPKDNFSEYKKNGFTSLTLGAAYNANFINLIWDESSNEFYPPSSFCEQVNCFTYPVGEARQAAVRQQQERDRERQQQEQEQQRAEEQQRRAEEQRRQDDARRQEEQRQQQIAEQQRQAEQARLDADNRQRAETEAEMVMAYTSVIHDLVQRNWSRPPSARNNMTAVLRIRLMPTGDVVDVEIVRSSGDFAFDRAAENAVQAVGRFSELQGMPPRMFERSFRSLLLTFRPEDLLN